jgi:hypothetical protein
VFNGVSLEGAVNFEGVLRGIAGYWLLLFLEEVIVIFIADVSGTVIIGLFVLLRIFDICLAARAG